MSMEKVGEKKNSSYSWEEERDKQRSFFTYVHYPVHTVPMGAYVIDRKPRRPTTGWRFHQNLKETDSGALYGEKAGGVGK